MNLPPISIPPTELDWIVQLIEHLGRTQSWGYSIKSLPHSDLIEISLGMPMSAIEIAPLCDPSRGWIELWGLYFDWLMEQEITRRMIQRAGRSFAREMDRRILEVLLGPDADPRIPGLIESTPPRVVSYPIAAEATSQPAGDVMQRLQDLAAELDRIAAEAGRAPMYHYHSTLGPIIPSPRIHR